MCVSTGSHADSGSVPPVGPPVAACRRATPTPTNRGSMTTDTPTTTPELHAAIAQLVHVARGMTDDLSPMTSFTCSEAEALADVIRASGEHDLARMLIEAHTAGDESSDERHDPQFDEYPETPPLPFLIDERINGLNYASTIIDGEMRDAREICFDGGIVFEYLAANGEWVEFDRHPA